MSENLAQKTGSTENDLKYLIFKIGEELYGAPLLSVREVLECQKPKFMPNMVSYFSGVINVRGAIVGVVDLRLKFGSPAAMSPRTAMLLCDTERGSVAAVVDRVVCVHQFVEADFDRQPMVRSNIKGDYLMGVAKKAESLVTVVDLHQLLTQEELRALTA